MAIGDRDLEQATGLAIAMMGSLMEAARITAAGDVSRHLANLAVVTAETSPAQGEILQRWARLMDGATPPSIRSDPH